MFSALMGFFFLYSVTCQNPVCQYRRQLSVPTFVHVIPLRDAASIIATSVTCYRGDEKGKRSWVPGFLE